MKLTITRSCDSRPVAFAARELTAYLDRMLPSEQALRIHLRVSGRESLDGFSVRIGPEGGEISGVNDRSVLLGVYDYLHFLGCRFLGPGKDSELVPAVRPEALPACYEKRASFLHRGVCIEGADARENVLEFLDWLPKVGYNSFFLQFKISYPFLARWYHHEGNPLRAPEPYDAAAAEADMRVFEAEIQKRGLLLHKVGHGWTGEVLGYPAFSWEKASRPLPEDRRPLAAEVNGVRALSFGIPADTNLCFDNPDALDTFAALVTDYARENPGIDYLHIWLADEYNNVCECGGCRRTTPSDQYVALLNEIDRRLTAQGLNTRLVFLLYQELLWPPVRERLENPDRFVLMFAPISRTFEASYDLSGTQTAVPVYRRNHIVLPTSLKENLSFLRGWQRLFQGDSFIYDYPLGRAHYGDFGYVHIARIIAGDIQQLRKMGLNGYISCQELRVSLPNSLPNYVMGYMLFDETTDPQALIREYFDAAYGRHAGQVFPYLEALSALNCCDYLNGKGPRTDPEITRRMARVIRLAEACPAAPAGEAESPFWKRLAYHRDYVLALARAVQALAAGRQAESWERWLDFRALICRSEPEYQPYLDVYRILEVTQKYTGFSPENS